MLFLVAWALLCAFTIYTGYMGALNFTKQYVGIFDKANNPISLLPPKQDEAAIVALQVIPALVAIAAAALLLRARRRKAAALMSVSLLFLTMTAFIGSNHSEATWPPALHALLHNAGWCGLIISFLIFPDGNLGTRRAQATAAAAVCVHLALIPYHLLVAPLSMLTGHIPDFVRAFFFAAAALALRDRLQSTTHPRRRRLIFVALVALVGATTLITVWAVLNLAAPYFGSHSLTIMRTGGRLRELGFACFGFGFLIALARYGLYDASQLFSRSAALAILATLAAGVFAGGEALLNSALPKESAYVAALVAALVVVPLRNAITGWTDKRLRQQLSGLRELPQDLADLRSMGSRADVLDEAGSRIWRAVQPERLAVIVGADILYARGVDSDEVTAWTAGALPGSDPPAALVDREDALFPLRIPLRLTWGGKVKPIGWMLLGPQTDELFYDAEELEALTSIGTPVARAISAARL
jgi:hypothetical protein